MPFSLEGTAFFIEAIALGFFLYGWDKFNKWFHWICGVIVGISGLASGILVVAANAWMNSPSGFDFINGEYLNIDPVKAMFNDAWFSQALHMTIAAFCATGFAVAGLHAYLILKGKNVNFHREAFKISSVLAITAAMLAPLSGDISAKDVAKRQPIKLAAMEAQQQAQAEAMQLNLSHADVDGLTGEVTASEEPEYTVNNAPFPVPESRNAPCPCGSGLKYKQCHGKI